jgi:hypothetical protein
VIFLPLVVISTWTGPHWVSTVGPVILALVGVLEVAADEEGLDGELPPVVGESYTPTGVWATWLLADGPEVDVW